MADSLESVEAYVRDAPDLYVVERQATFDVDATRTLLKVSLAEIAGVGVQPYTELCSAPGVGEINVNVVPIDRLFEPFNRLFGPKAGLDPMLPLAEPVYQALFPGSVWIRSGSRWRRIPGHLFHLHSKAKRSHVGPDFLDVSETLSFCP